MPIDKDVLERLEADTIAERISWGVECSQRNAHLIDTYMRRLSGFPLSPGLYPRIEDLRREEKVLIEAVRAAGRFANYALDVIEEERRKAVYELFPPGFRELLNESQASKPQSVVVPVKKPRARGLA